MITTTNKHTMKKIMLIASAMLASLTGVLHAQTNILKHIESAQAKTESLEEAALKDNWTSRLGAGWKQKWRESTLRRPNDQLVEIYIEKGEFPVKPTDNYAFKGISPLKKQEWLAYIGGKTEITENDFTVVKGLGAYHPLIVSRKDDFLKFLECGPDIKGEEYFEFLISKVEVRGSSNPNLWRESLKISEWFTLVSSNSAFNALTFSTGRDAIAMKAARLLLEKRKAENLSVEGEEFDAAFEPILNALKAPKFAGLSDACDAVGINMELPSNIDWTAQEAIAAAVISAAERNGKFTTAWNSQLDNQKGLGSVMFIKGESAYSAWREETIAKD